MGRRKFSGGEPFRVNHQDHNRWQEAGEYVANRQNGEGGSIELPDEQTGIILVKNTTALDLPRFSVLGLEGSVHDPNYDPQQLQNFKNQIVLRGVMPGSDTEGKFCVLVVDARAGEVVPAMVSGATAVRLDVSDADDTHADVETDTGVANRTRYLKTGTSGAAQIIYVYEQEGEQWGVVRLSNKPTGGAQIKVVRYGWLPAAYGGSSTLGIGGAAAIANGNTTPSNRQIFPKLWENKYTINSSGDFQLEPGGGYVVNIGSLPLFNGWAVATKLPDQHPFFGDLWAVTSELAPSHYGAGVYNWNAEENAGDWEFTDGEADLIRGTGSVDGEGDPRLWHLNWYGDVMLTHFGWWEVTFGYQGHVYGTDEPYYDATSSSSAGHTHTYRLPAGFTVQCGVHKNFNPGTTVIGTNSDLTCEMRNHHMGPHPITTIKKNEYEKTCLIKSDESPWHGQHHTRLSMYIKVALDSAASSAGTPRFILDRAWLSVRPAHAYNLESIQGFGAGANQYPGGYLNGAGTFVWYGGGSEPVVIDKDGAVVP
jgi:hypothetical protein